MYSSLYPSIILENNLAPNTQIGRIIIEDKDNPDKAFSLNEHPDMYSSDDETAKYSRGGEFLENMMSGNPLEFGRRWLGLGDVYQVLEDLKEFFEHNRYYGKPVDYDFRDTVYFVRSKDIDVITIDDRYQNGNILEFNNKLSKEESDRLVEEIGKGALL